MKTRFRNLALLAVFGGLFFFLSGSGHTAPLASQDLFMDPWILDSIGNDGQTEFLVLLSEQADLSPVAGLKTKEEKGRFALEALTAVANRTQAPIIEELRASQVSYKPYWIVNMIWVRGNLETATALAERDDTVYLFANPPVLMDMPFRQENNKVALPTGVEWNIQNIDAPAVWDLGYTGQGIVIGGQDTGYDWTHQDLIAQYRGWDGLIADHNYNWHDAVHSEGGSCGANSIEPCDDLFHGTHTMGTMVGNGKSTNAIGVAPGARWIGCRNMDRGVGTPATYSECFQWFMAPTDLDDKNPDPSKAPHIINNSWSCPPSEGCNNPAILQMVVENVRAAGILTVHSTGNDGPDCSTIDTPAAIYDAALSIGATTKQNDLADFSSRGPVIVDNSGRLKPDLVAPGQGIRSSVPGDYYLILNGTSMAAPHVSGLAALLLSADPSLIGQVDDIEAAITSSALGMTVEQDCGSISGGEVPNNSAGFGRANALAAVISQLGKRIRLPAIFQADPTG